jgi:hypothetical protein
MRRPESNQTPVVTSIVVVGASVVLLLAAGAILGLDPKLLGRAAGTMVLAGVVLGAWASHATTSWSRAGYAWRFGVAWALVVMLGVVCGVFAGPAPAES